MLSFFLTAGILTLSVTASPLFARQLPITLPFTKVINTTGTSIVQSDQARIRALMDRTIRNAKEYVSPINTPVTNQAVYYLAAVGIGTPPTVYNLIVDTGSSITWVGASPSKPYVITSSSIDTGYGASVSYGSGFMIGEEYNDTVTIGPIDIYNQSIVGAEFTIGFTSEDGILGLGPIDLTEADTTSDREVPTVVDTAFYEGLTAARSIAVSFEPTNVTPIVNGEITIGSVDSTKYIPQITYTPTTTTSPASQYWGIDQAIFYNGEIISNTTAGIVDTGTTFLWLASDAYARYQNATGALFDDDTSLLTITQDQYEHLADLVFDIGGTEFALTPNAQIWPRTLNTLIDGTADKIYLVVGNLGRPTGSGNDFTDGQVFLERFYSVYDSASNSVGLANTVLTRSVIN
ncbi:hypothetical protein NM688_g2188 [Phlebia brevispora]|uniref:Uncharacterized protein n=1 Tax=Phlebia brevispora TaxID=194682 RepID=A0ACC1T8Z9_9APHY|nr:hypothetical protein NM688_g2188 [Phlebia brevispora]